MPSKRRTCSDESCAIHRWPYRKGMHGAGELVGPSGSTEALVVRRWDDNGRRIAYQLRYDRQCWSGRLALPSRPRAGHEAAVGRARVFVKTGEVR
jgi:hypothetical protein